MSWWWWFSWGWAWTLSSSLSYQALLMWPTGIASEEGIHGAAQLLMNSISKIRAAFTFRRKYRWSYSFCQKICFNYLERRLFNHFCKDNDLVRSFFREAAHKLLVKASENANPDNKRSGRGKAARRDVDFVCVHIRRSVWHWDLSNSKVLRGTLEFKSIFLPIEMFVGKTTWSLKPWTKCPI